MAKKLSDEDLIQEIGLKPLQVRKLRNHITKLEKSSSPASEDQGENQTYLLRLSGPVLEIYHPSNTFSAIHKLIFRSHEWIIEDDPNYLTLTLTPSTVLAGVPFVATMRDRDTFDQWKEKLTSLIRHTRTHGIDVENHEVLHPIVQETLNDPEKRLFISAWDFAGQHEYYDQHHLFLQARTVFLVAFKLGKNHQEDEEEIRGLQFWLFSLKAQLFDEETRQLKKNHLFSIIIVATHADQREDFGNQASFGTRKAIAFKLAHQIFGESFPLQYHEVSCLGGSQGTRGGIKQLEEAIYKTMLAHSYMGEIIPRAYLDVEEGIIRLREERKRDRFLVARMEDVQAAAEEVAKQRGEGADKLTPELIRRAVSLLAAWGICCYFDFPELRELVILDPSFLTKDTLAHLFQPDFSLSFKNGILNPKDLALIWVDSASKYANTLPAEKVISLLEKLEVCFTLEQDRSLPFEERRIIITARLPEQRPSSLLEKVFPPDCPPTSIQVQQFFLFDVMPTWVISRLLARLYQQLTSAEMWKFGLYFNKEQLKALVEARLKGMMATHQKEDQLVLTVRGKDRAECIGLMKILTDSVKELAKNFKGLALRQAVPSPATKSPGVFVEIDDILMDSQREKKDRRLVCPETHEPLNAEELLVGAGLKNSSLRGLILNFFSLMPATSHKRQTENPPNETKRNKTKQNKTKRNEAKPNQTKQNQNKLPRKISTGGTFHPPPPGQNQGSPIPSLPFPSSRKERWLTRLFMRNSLSCFKQHPPLWRESRRPLPCSAQPFKSPLIPTWTP